MRPILLLIFVCLSAGIAQMARQQDLSTADSSHQAKGAGDRLSTVQRQNSRSIITNEPVENNADRLGTQNTAH
jgi:hypothetical protein